MIASRPVENADLGEAEIATLSEIGHHYARFGEYEKALYVFLLVRRHAPRSDARAINRLIDLAYKSGCWEIYYRLVENRSKDAAHRPGPMRVALYYLLKGKTAKAFETFRKYVA